ncbi:MAG: ABC transporter permease [Propionicimonas sp.]|uniref:ABC transporter permease n=1 Tax=Propionicimonas sp. TaxID=1955623 RepID=UPI002B212A2D|nr:ABC transporter permease [Propionicimonas sp.]MEA4945248.1 ABC transporter permease [Propionicimonas sp.]
MKSLRRLRLLIWKEFLQLRHDPFLAGILIVAPVVQLIMFGYVVAVDITHLNTAVIDLDHTVTSRAIDASFASSEYFTVTQRPGSEDEVRQLLDQGTIQLAVVIPAGTETALTQGETAPIGVIVDGSDSQVSALAGGYASQIIAGVNSARAAQLGATVAGAPGIDAQVRVLFNPTLSSINTMVPGLVAVISMLSLMIVMSQAVVKERESGTLEQMFVTPIRAGEYIIGKITPYVLLAIAQMLIVASVGIGWFKVPFAGSVWVVVVGMLLFMLTSIGLGLLVSLMAHTRQQAQQVIVFLMMPFMILSGFIFPIESMPAWLQPVSRAIPMTYALEMLRGVFVKGSGFADLATPLLALAGFGVVIFGTAVVATRRRITA